MNKANRGGSLDQRAIHAEALVTQQVQAVRLDHDRVEELATHAMAQQPRAVLGKRAVGRNWARACPYRGTSGTAGGMSVPHRKHAHCATGLLGKRGTNRTRGRGTPRSRL